MITHRVASMFPVSGIDRVFGDFFGDAFHAANAGAPVARAFPPMNIAEENETITVEAELPGFKMEDIEITLEGDQLTVAGQRSAEQHASNTTFRRRERASGRFTRTLRLPYDIDAEKVQASLANGVLTIALPKSDAAKPRKIQVRQA